MLKKFQSLFFRTYFATINEAHSEQGDKSFNPCFFGHTLQQKFQGLIIGKRLSVSILVFSDILCNVEWHEYCEGCVLFQSLFFRTYFATKIAIINIDNALVSILVFSDILCNKDEIKDKSKGPTLFQSLFFRTYFAT